MFLLNSCLGHFSAADRSRLPLSLTYGVNLPSSLTMLLPLVLGFSPHLPVSVCGTGGVTLNSSFSRQHEIKSFGTYFPSFGTQASVARTSLSYTLVLSTDASGCLRLYPSVSLRLSNALHQCRNVYLLSIDYASWPRLRTRLTLGGRPFPRKP